MIKKFTFKSVALLKDERGSLDKLAWVLGATVVTVAVIVLLIRIMPQTTEIFFGAATSWLRTSFGF